MFYDCNLLTSLDVSNWNTSKVTNMGNMFYDCNLLTSLDISNWDTSRVGTLSGFITGTSATLIIYYNSSLTSSALTDWMTTYSSKTWIDVSTQNLAQQVNTLQEESDIMMLALTELYETNAANGATTNTSTATTFGLRARATVSYIDVLMPTIYAKLIKRGYKTIDDVPATLLTSVQEIINQTE